ncbi:MAG: chemotaxis-specific protein-glutamate methyltransferase CheB [Pseudomonadota bacterium]
MIRLLVVDDSALMRRLLGDVFRAEGDFEVVTARDGAEALETVASFKPDVVTLDVQMPRMDGLACLNRIMLERPCPVVMVSALTAAGAEVTLEALQLGAVDFVAKPGGAISLSIDELGPVLVETVRAAAGAKLRSSLRLQERVRMQTGGAAAPSIRPAPRADLPPAECIVLVGCSTGGPQALDTLLGPLSRTFPWPILIAQHMPQTFTGPLSRRLDKLTDLTVMEVTSAVGLQPGHAYVGRGGADLVVSRRPGGLVALAAPAAPAHRWHPSVDRLVTSALQHLPATAVIGVLLTGMGDDGAAAMTRLRAGGGRTIAESEDSAVVWGMPGELVRLGGAEAVLPLEAIAGMLRRWAA